MKNTNQKGFIPMLILLVIVIGAVIWFVYERVAQAQK